MVRLLLFEHGMRACWLRFYFSLLLEVMVELLAVVHVNAQLDKLLVAFQLLLVQSVQKFFLLFFLEDEHHTPYYLGFLSGISRLLVIEVILILNCHVSRLAYCLNVELRQDFCYVLLRILGHHGVRLELLEESIALHIHLVENHTVLLILGGFEAAATFGI